MSLIDEYLECINDYTIVDRTLASELFENATKNLRFHVGGRISQENSNCVYYSSVDELKLYLKSLGISENEKIILLPFVFTVPIVNTILKNFYDCFYDCLAACSDVWIIFDNHDLLIEFNHDDEIIVCVTSNCPQSSTL